jgi:hypothetical protein
LSKNANEPSGELGEETDSDETGETMGKERSA